MGEKLIQITVKATVTDAEAKLKELEKILADFERQAKDVGASVQQSTSVTSQSFLNLENVAKLALAGVALFAEKYARQAIQAIEELAESAARNIDIAEGFEALTTRIGIQGDRLVQLLQDAARGTIDQYNIMLMATKALDLGIAASTDDLVKLMEIARVRAKRYGMSTAQAFQMLIDGISSGRPMMLRHLGFLADTEEAYNAVAASMGKEANELTLLQQKQATFQAILQTGQPDLEAWESTADDASDAFERYHVTMTELRQELGEAFLPAVVEAMGAVIGLKNAILDTDERALDQFETIVRTSGSLEEMARRFSQLTEQQRDGGRWTQEGTKAWQEQTTTLEGWGKVIQALVQGTQEDVAAMRAAEHMTLQLGDAQVKAADDTEYASKAASRAADTWHNYLTSIERENWGFSQSVSQAQFRAAQAAEDAAFRLGEIERDSAERGDDLVSDYYLDELDKLEKHQMEIRWARQDHLDALADMEWQYQQDKKDLLDQAPWWVRYALQAEFAERDRIARAGDKDALAKYDAYLLEKVRLEDPAHAKELQKLQQQYNHEKKIEDRENKQGLRRDQAQFNQENRAQERQFNHQLDVIERELRDQREAWEFHDRQRRENEAQAMDNLITEHGHKLDTLYQDTQYKLSQLPPLYYDAGYASGVKWTQGLNDAKADYGYSPSTGYDPSDFVNPWASAQFGMPYVPRTMPVMVHQGEAILNPAQANQWRGGDVSIGELHLHGNYTPFLARKMAKELAEQLGPMIQQRSR